MDTPLSQATASGHHLANDKLSTAAGSCQRDRILERISDPFLGPTQRLFFSQQRAYKLANVSHTLVSKLETIAVYERAVTHIERKLAPTISPVSAIMAILV